MMTHFDPISLEILWSRLINISEECWITLWRTAFSLIIGEAQDFGCELLDANGQSLAHAPRSMPVFNLTLPMAVRGLLQHFPAETLQPGDVLVTNDPWICAGHLPDLALVTPVFRGKQMVGLVGSIAHCSDIGGTRDAMTAREVYEEGLQIPPLKLYRGGVLNDDLLRLIERNVRKGAMVVGDIQAQVSANGVGGQRLLAFMDEYGLDDLTALAATIQQRAEEAMRAAIRNVPDGTYRHAITFENAGNNYTLPVTITIAGDEAIVDWRGAPPQVARGGINCTLSYTAAHSVYALKCLLTPEIPSNAGCFRPIRVLAPEGSILNCRYPASVSMRLTSGWYCAPAIFGAMAEVLPGQVQSFTGMPMGCGAYGGDGKGGFYNDHLLQGGGQGASERGDGKNTLLYPTSAANTSIELFEARTPLLVEEKALVPGSGGAGKQRGGLGQRMTLRKLHEDGIPAQISVQPYAQSVDLAGLYGGQPGRRASARWQDGERTIEGSAFGGFVELRSASERVTMEMGGGSGFGDPHQRPLNLIQQDLDEGLIAMEDLTKFGCWLDERGIVQR